MASAAKASPSPGAAATADELGVKIEAQFTVGEYEVVVLSAQDSSGLDTWLHLNKYKIPDGAEPILRPYVAAGMKFFVAKVDAKKVRFENGQAMLSPLRFHYDTDTFTLPVRLGLLNSAGTQDLIVHILARGKRYEVSNYPNVLIPTNYDVAEDVKSRFGEFYAALFDRTIEQNPGAIVTEYAWDAQSCDPCPGPALNPADIATLGADALLPTETTATDPSFVATVRVSDVVSAGIRNAEAQAQVWKNSFQQCYFNALKQQPSPRGKLHISLKIEDAGRIAEVKTEADKGLPATIIPCVEASLRRAYVPILPGQRPTLSFSVQLDVRAPEPGEPGWYRPPMPNLWGFTLTRLHARYGKNALGQDLVFKEASGLIGGREEAGQKQQDHGAKPSSINNFQGRYIIRHPWTGPITCAEPRRGVWGGPPSGTAPASLVAKDTAFAPRGKVSLASLLREPVPELKLAPSGASAEGAGTQKGCGSCSAEGPSGVRIPAALAALLALTWAARTRRRHPR